MSTQSTEESVIQSPQHCHLRHSNSDLPSSRMPSLRISSLGSIAKPRRPISIRILRQLTGPGTDISDHDLSLPFWP